MQVTDAMVAKAHAEYHKVLGDKNRSDPMRTALTAALAEMWQDIEEAPKDGARLLLVDADPDPIPDTPCIGWWGDHEWRDHGLAGCNGSLGYRPTHFMPLPAPPRGK